MLGWDSFAGLGCALVAGLELPPVVELEMSPVAVFGVPVAGAELAGGVDSALVWSRAVSCILPVSLLVLSASLAFDVAFCWGGGGSGGCRPVGAPACDCWLAGPVFLDGLGWAAILA